MGIGSSEGSVLLVSHNPTTRPIAIPMWINTIQESRHYGEEPDLISTCKTMPRAGYTPSLVTESCREVALSLKSHRTADGQECSVCDFRHVEGKRIGCPATLLSTSRARLSQKMRSHDEACSCRCFHVDSYGAPTIDDSLGDPQLHARTEKHILNKELEIQSNTPDQKWELASRRFTNDIYWMRAVKHDNDIWHQYGISERPNDDGPEFFFTCKMKSYRKGDEQKIRQVCKDVAANMRAHRSRGSADDYHRCACNFKTWRKGKELSGCHVSWYHLTDKMIKDCVGFDMAYHDRLCSCGCFDVQTGGDSNVSGQRLRD
jgi:hypothetical protein